MLRYLASRIIGLVGVTLVVSFLAFMMLYKLPGGPFSQTRQPLSATAMAAIRAKYRLDQPFYVVWFSWVTHAMIGDFGTSYKAENVPIIRLFADHWGVSLQLGALALSWSLPLGILGGILAATHRNKAVDLVLRILCTLATSIPSFTLALGLLFLFAVRLHWVASSAWKPLENPGGALLPVFIFGLGPFGVLLRYTRNGLLDGLSQDYVRTARAKGLHERFVIRRHVLRNVMIPIITVLAPMLPGALTGSALIERVFGINGIGSYFIDSITSRDYPMVLATTVLVAMLWGLTYVLTDVLYVMIDPRIRLGSRVQ